MDFRPRSIALCLSAAAVAASALAVPAAAVAQANVFLNGTITRAGTPLPGATVTLTGGTTARRAVTDARGRFAFPGLTVGTYTVTATAGAEAASERVDLGSSGADVILSVTQLRAIGRTSVTARTPTSQRSGADTVLNGQALTRTARSGSLGDILVAQVPGTARGANGTTHINGDHGDINYIVDGVQLPLELNRAVGSEFDPSNIAFAEVLQGAYPAQYGLRFGAVVNIGTPSNAGPPGTGLELKAGSFGSFDTTLQRHGPLHNGGSYIVSLRNERDGRALDPPNPGGAPHNAGSNTAQLLRFTLPAGKDFYNFTLTHSLQTYQIPVDVAGIGGAAVPAALDDDQLQDDTFASFQYRHAIGDRGAFSIGPSVKRSRLLDTGDPPNDLAAALSDPNAPAAGTLPARGATPATCANAFAPALFAQGAPTGALADCALSIFADRTSLDYQLNAEYALRSTKHELRAGGLYDTTTVTKNYAVTLQPNSPLGAGAATVYDNAPNVGHTESLYVQDTWRMSPGYTLDLGLRGDAFQLASTQFRDAEFMLSPRIKLTRAFGPRISLYAYYGRFFTPYSFENVSPATAQCLNPPAAAFARTTCAGPAAASVGFDLKAQRDSVYEVGAFLPLGATAHVGLRLMQKNSTDVVDDVQVGTTNLHQDINYRLGRIAVQTLYVAQPLARGGRVYGSVSHDRAYVRQCETQLLAACAGQAPDWIPADHDQRWDANAGFTLDDRRGGYFSFGGEYGSGLSTAPSDSTVDTTIQGAVQNPYCPAPPGGIGASGCKSPPHILLDAEKGFAVGKGATLALGVENLLNNRYLITYRNAQGIHYGRPRTILLKYTLQR